MLSILIWLPVLAAAIIFLIPVKIDSTKIRLVALAFSILNILIALAAIARYDYQLQGLQLREFLPWLEVIGLNYNLGIDGLSLPLVVLNNLLVCVAIYSGNLAKEDNILIRPKLFTV